MSDPAGNPNPGGVSPTTVTNSTVSYLPEEVVQTIAQAGWFIGLICVIIFLLIILCIVCLIKRNRGGKYPGKLTHL